MQLKITGLKNLKMDNREKFDKYCNGELDYTKLTGELMNWDMQVWEKLGKYVEETLGDNLDKWLKFEKDYATELGRDYSRGFGIYFFTSSLNYDTLQLMFNDPILHNEYGEGFDEDDEDDEDGNHVQSEYSAISFFETIEDVEFHLSNDHRGTAVEAQCGTDPEKIFKGLKRIIDIYKEKCTKQA
jgi:hypothetical protein